MSVCRKLPDGTIQKIAGHTILLDANASEIRTGTFAIQGAASTSTSVQVTFTDPMPDTDYIVVYETQTEGGYPPNTEPSTVTCTDKTTTGFTASMWCFAAMSEPMVIKYTAWKPVKIEGYTALQNKVENPDDTPTEDSMNLVTSDGVWRAIKNASAVWKGTKSEWTALPVADKKEYDLAVLVDVCLIKAVDRTDGSDTDVADLGQIWKGTRTAWEALSLAERKSHSVAFFTDKRYAVAVDPSTGDESNLVDWTGVWKGSMEDWEALTQAERDEWDVCITPTITPTDTNPFRTLSDPEAITLASEVDYECPHDGFITVSSGISVNITAYINGTVIAEDRTEAKEKSVFTVPVCKGDTFKYVSALTADLKARWYTNEVSPGEPDVPVLYRSQSLDWDNKVDVYPAPTSYTFDRDGYIFVQARYTTNKGTIYVNDVPILVSQIPSGNMTGCAPVSKGDVLTWSNDSHTGLFTFVPYLDYPDYSTTEHWTGRRWIDGKKIYSRVFTGLSFNGNSSSWVNTGATVSGLERVIECKGWREDSEMGLVHYTCESYDENGALYIHGMTNGLNPTSCLYVEYTKVSD